jgi:hypothetical protein
MKSFADGGLSMIAFGISFHDVRVATIFFAAFVEFNLSNG